MFHCGVLSVRGLSRSSLSIIPAISPRQREVRGASTATDPNPAAFLDTHRRMKMRKVKKAEKRKIRDQGTLVNGVSGSNGEVLDFEIQELVKGHTPEQLPEPFSEIELKVIKLSSTGDGLALSESGRHVYIIPFSIPGDTVLAKVVSHCPANKYSQADFLKVIHPSPERDDSLVRCKYFSKCSGCQLQIMPYEKQLKYKQNVVENAYRCFSKLPSEAIPTTEPTHGSPLQYGYRTKLTPHFDAFYRKRTVDGKFKWAEIPPIGFAIEGMKKTMDIEECPIGTEIINKGLTVERERVKKEIETFKQGATLLLRESTKRILKDADQTNGHAEATRKETPDHQDFTCPSSEIKQQANKPPQSNIPTVSVDRPNHTDIKTCITSHNALSTENVDSYTFTNTAGAFFQNNNSVLGPFTSYIRSLCISPPLSPSFPAKSPSPTTSIASQPLPTPIPTPQISYLLDAYCGSGLFAITLASLFRATLGIDIDERSITAARRNAELNAPLIRIQSSNSSPSSPPTIGFIHADAARLFADIPFPPSETMVVIDPPRKGCSLDFLRQLRRFGPKRMVYVSCNVHSQARDVGWLVRGEIDGEDGERQGGEGKVTRYRIERLAGWDFFPQTAHVEGVAVLERVDS